MLLKKPLGKSRRILGRTEPSLVNKVGIIVDMMETPDGEQIVSVDLCRQNFVQFLEQLFLPPGMRLVRVN